jgi:uncharacterized protein YkwD
MPRVLALTAIVSFACVPEGGLGTRLAIDPTSERAASDAGLASKRDAADFPDGTAIADASGTMPMPDASAPDALALDALAPDALSRPDATISMDAGFAPGDPAGRSEREVCDAWAEGHRRRAAASWTAGPSQCDPGRLPSEAIDDTLRRVNLFRWLAGLPAVVEDPDQSEDDQACAIMEATNGQLNHTPPASWACYSEDGARGAATSNLALGSGSAADAVDLFIEDSLTPSLGHRRWVLNGPLDGIGIGYASPGGGFGATCLGVFSMGGRSFPTWSALPNPGPAPRFLASGTWSFHSNHFGLSRAEVSVVRASDGAALTVAVDHPQLGYGPNTVSFSPSGWAPQTGETYRVTISGIDGSAPITYEVTIARC